MTLFVLRVRMIQGGIIPDQTVMSNWDEVTEDTDPLIKAALEHFDQ